MYFAENKKAADSYTKTENDEHFGNTFHSSYVALCNDYGNKYFIFEIVIFL